MNGYSPYWDDPLHDERQTAQAERHHDSGERDYVNEHEDIVEPPPEGADRWRILDGRDERGEW